jgi:hypothetical protein
MGMSHRSWRPLLLAAALVLGLGAPIAAPLSNAAAAPAAVTGPDDRSVDRLYLAYFERVPDTAGAAFWESRLAAGLGLRAISEQFARSPEFVASYGALDDDEFVELVYTNVLDRTPDAGGFAHWTSQLDAGLVTRGDVMLAFSDSAEFKASSGVIGLPPWGPDGRSVERLYLAYFGRDPDPGGLAFWNAEVDRGVSLTAVSASFARSAEFAATYGPLGDVAFVELVYRNVLDRAPDDGGLSHWMAQLDSGALDRGGVMLAFSDSAEYKGLTGVHGARPVPPSPDPGVVGNPNGGAAVPGQARAVDTSSPDHLIGSGTPASCTSAAVVAAVAAGGTIRFDCGSEPVTIVMTETAKVFNNANPDVVIDGGGLVTLSGGGQRRILYMNTCDPAQVWTTSHCQNQDHPRLTVQNLGFVDGNSIGQTAEGGGGGAIFVRGGRLKIVNSIFTRNRCDGVGPDVGGAAVRVLSQYNGLPVYVVNSTFGGGPDLGNVCSNGAALSSIGVSMTVINSRFTHNDAIGYGANPARSGTPGGGSGGAIYNDGNTFTLQVLGTIIEDNTAREGGGAIFFVSNNRTGSLIIDRSTLQRNPSAGFETAGLPGIFYLGNGAATVTGSSLS